MCKILSFISDALHNVSTGSYAKFLIVCINCAPMNESMKNSSKPSGSSFSKYSRATSSGDSLLGRYSVKKMYAK